jgi:hypothetical protein
MRKGEVTVKEMIIQLLKERIHNSIDVLGYLNKAVLVMLVIQVIFWLSLGTPHAQENCWSIPTVTGEFVYPEGWFSKLEWDPTNPQTVDRSSSVPVSVLNGEGGFSWEVAGNDFWFNEEHTEGLITTDGRSVTLYAGPNACGGATISVTDMMGDAVTGSLRCTDGRCVLTAGTSISS